MHNYFSHNKTIISYRVSQYLTEIYIRFQIKNNYIYLHIHFLKKISCNIIIIFITMYILIFFCYILIFFVWKYVYTNMIVTIKREKRKREKHVLEKIVQTTNKEGEHKYTMRWSPRLQLTTTQGKKEIKNKDEKGSVFCKREVSNLKHGTTKGKCYKDGKTISAHVLLLWHDAW